VRQLEAGVAGDKRTRIVIADDHPLYREALTTAFGRTADIEASASVDDLDQALAALAGGDIALALLDLDMPGMGGTAGVARVRALHPETRVAVISGSVGSAQIRDALTAGACGYVPKTFTPDMILAAVRLMLSGAIYVPPDALVAPLEAASDGRAPATPSNLTPRELEVLQMLTKGAANKEIARAIGVAEVTVKLHTRRILEKLGVRNRAAAAAIAVRTGLVTDDPVT
jgi:DNA-binding NarL/FixJ family response regulator